jgi:hypothetical protein
MQTIQEKLVLLQGYDPTKKIVTPANVSPTYIDISEIWGLPRLQKNTMLTKFRTCMKLDLLKTYLVSP